MYLRRTAIKETLLSVRRISAPGSQVVMDLLFHPDSPDVLSTMVRMTPNLVHLLGEPVTFLIHPEDMEALLGRLGFALVDLNMAADLEAKFVRDDRTVYPAIYTVLAQTR